MKRLLALTALAFTVEASAITGDLNLDGVVDFDDFFIFTDNFGKSGSPSSADCGGYDPDIAPGGEPALLTDVSMANEGSAYCSANLSEGPRFGVHVGKWNTGSARDME
jgi:hypothetical protein